MAEILRPFVQNRSPRAKASGARESRPRELDQRFSFGCALSGARQSRRRQFGGRLSHEDGCCEDAMGWNWGCGRPTASWTIWIIGQRLAGRCRIGALGPFPRPNRAGSAEVGRAGSFRDAETGISERACSKKACYAVLPDKQTAICCRINFASQPRKSRPANKQRFAAVFARCPEYTAVGLRVSPVHGLARIGLLEGVSENCSKSSFVSSGVPNGVPNGVHNGAHWGVLGCAERSHSVFSPLYAGCVVVGRPWMPIDMNVSPK